jgi:two-component system, OmpR family, response regulator
LYQIPAGYRKGNRFNNLSMHHKKVLIIDDEIDLCHLLKSHLSRKDYEVHLSHTLKNALSYIDQLKPDIVFLDNNLPDGVGWEIAPQLAASHPNIFIILISAFHPALPEMPLNSHYKYIEKPISIADLDSQFTTLEL